MDIVIHLVVHWIIVATTTDSRLLLPRKKTESDQNYPPTTINKNVEKHVSKDVNKVVTRKNDSQAE